MDDQEPRELQLTCDDCGRAVDEDGECTTCDQTDAAIAVAAPVQPLCGSADPHSPRRCNLPAGHDGCHDDSRYPVGHDWSTTHGPKNRLNPSVAVPPGPVPVEALASLDDEVSEGIAILARQRDRALALLRDAMPYPGKGPAWEGERRALLAEVSDGPAPEVQQGEAKASEPSDDAPDLTPDCGDGGVHQPWCRHAGKPTPPPAAPAKASEPVHDAWCEAAVRPCYCAARAARGFAPTAAPVKASAPTKVPLSERMRACLASSGRVVIIDKEQQAAWAAEALQMELEACYGRQCMDRDAKKGAALEEQLATAERVIESWAKQCVVNGRERDEAKGRAGRAEASVKSMTDENEALYEQNEAMMAEVEQLRAKLEERDAAYVRAMLGGERAIREANARVAEARRQGWADGAKASAKVAREVAANAKSMGWEDDLDAAEGIAEAIERSVPPDEPPTGTATVRERVHAAMRAAAAAGCCNLPQCAFGGDTETMLCDALVSEFAGTASVASGKVAK